MKPLLTRGAASAGMLLAACAHADDYGCKVLLCLSNPAGPRAVAECRPPIDRFLREQARRNPPPYPRCEEAQGEAEARPGSGPYDPCPPGTTALARGAAATRQVAGADGATGQGAVPPASIYLGIGEGDAADLGAVSNAAKVCVGQRMGAVDLVTGSGEASTSQHIEIYDAIVTLEPSVGSATIVDVFIGGRLYRRVRF